MLVMTLQYMLGMVRHWVSRPKPIPIAPLTLKGACEIVPMGVSTCSDSMIVKLPIAPEEILLEMLYKLDQEGQTVGFQMSFEVTREQLDELLCVARAREQ